MATKRTLPLAALQQTPAYLFDGQSHALSGPFEHWLTTSKPFTSFTQTYQQKIRKKIRTAQDPEELYNLYCELRTAYLLLQEARFAVEYEPFTKQSGRSADFAVTYRTRTPFHVEVTRLRLSQQEQPLVEQEPAEVSSGLEESIELTRRYGSRRLADVACDKLGQLSSNTPNVLFMWVQCKVMQEGDMEQALTALKRRAEQRDADLLARYGFRNPADFMRHYQRLSLVLVQSLHAQEAEKAPLAWANRDARYPLPAALRDRLYTLVTMDTSQDFSVSSQ